MIYPAVAVVLAVIALAIVFLSLRVLIGPWLLGWLRGTFGLLLAAAAIFIALAAWDLHAYKQVLETKPIGTLSFNKLEEQRYAVNLVDPAGNEQRYELYGDLWQLDVRLLRWTDALARFGLKPGYRLDRLSGRYLSLEDEQKQPRTVLDLSGDKPLFDVWAWLQRVNRYFSVIDAKYGSATYLPMVDGALYSVNIGSSGVLAYPLNERAKQAVEHWQ